MNLQLTELSENHANSIVFTTIVLTTVESTSTKSNVMATRVPRSRGSVVMRMTALYSASLASLLAGAHIVHSVMNPDLVRDIRIPLLQIISYSDLCRPYRHFLIPRK